MIAVEIRKQVWRLRTYIGFGLLAVIPIIFTVAYKVNPPTGGHLDRIRPKRTDRGVGGSQRVLADCRGITVRRRDRLRRGELGNPQLPLGQARLSR